MFRHLTNPTRLVSTLKRANVGSIVKSTTNSSSPHKAPFLSITQPRHIYLRSNNHTSLSSRFVTKRQLSTTTQSQQSKVIQPPSQPHLPEKNINLPKPPTTSSTSKPPLGVASAAGEPSMSARTARKYNLPAPEKVTELNNADLKAMPKKKRRIFRKLFLLSILAITGFVGYEAVNSPGFHRSNTFWSRAFPIYMHYQMVIVWLDIRQALTNVLLRYDTEYYAPILADLGLDSKGEPIPMEESVSIEPNPVILNQEGQPIIPTPPVTEIKKAKANVLPPSPITTWGEQKAKSDLEYITALKQLIAEDDAKNNNSLPMEITESSSNSTFVRPIPMEQARNENKLDRLVANIHVAAKVITESEEFKQLQQRLDTLTVTKLTTADTIQAELKHILNDTLALSTHLPPIQEAIYYLKCQFNLLTGAVCDALPLDDETREFLGDKYYSTTNWIDTNIIKPSVIAVAPHLRQYTLPLCKDQRKTHRDDVFDPLNNMYADDLYSIIAELKGYYIKIGQMGAMRAEFLPKQWVHQLQRFQNDCPSVPFSSLVPMLEKEIGSISSNFEYIDPKPLGAASIGQAHLARLKNGQQVVIKIQYPDVEESFYQDMKTIRDFCSIAQPEQLTQLNEVEAAFLSEFNFAKEAVQLHFAERDLEKVRESGMSGNNKDDEMNDFAKFLTIPKPIPHLCSKHCLVMEYLPGQRLSTYLRNEAQRLADNQGMTFEDFLEKYGSTPPPTTEEIRQYKQMASSYDYFTNLGNTIYNYTAGWFVQPKEYQKTIVPVDIRRIIKYTYQAIGYEVFLGTLFHSDPHPGNILFCPNDNDLGGTIGLIDYGQVKSLDLWYRAILAHLMIALQDKDYGRVADICFFTGFRSVHNYQASTAEQVVLGFDYDDEVTRRGMNIEAYFATISAFDKPLQIQEKLALAGQSTFFLRALPQHLGFTVRASDMWAPIGRQFLAQHPILDEVVKKGIEEFSKLYSQELIRAKTRALSDIGRADEYFVDLSHGYPIQDWCEAIGKEYSAKYHSQIFTSPLPDSLIDYNADPRTESDERSKLRGDKLIEVTHNTPIGQFIPQKGQYIPQIHKNSKPYDFWAEKPQFINSLEQNYIPPQQNSV